MCAPRVGIKVRFRVISRVRLSVTHTRTLGLPRIDGEAGVAAFAHGRAVRGAVSTGFGETVRAIAYVGWHINTRTYAWGSE